MSNFITFSKFGSHGHLGNQIFQFCAVYSYSKLKNKNIVFTNDKKNSMFFKCFDIDDVLFVNSITPSSTYVEKKFNYDENIWNKNVDDLLGYLQSEKYFKSHSQDLKEKLKFKNKPHDLNDHIFIHVRRGDYLNFPDIHPICSEEYYLKSIEIMKNKYGSDVKFTIFSDNIEETKKYKCFKQNNINYSNDDAYVSLYKMKTCMSGIIANSSFSWWGSWLIDNIHKTIIAPNNWFGSRGPSETFDIYCDGWTKI